MKRSTRVLLVVCALGLTAWLSPSTAHAQFRYNPYSGYAQAQAMQQNWYAQQLAYTQQAQVYGTNYGIPIYASTVANYYTPNYTPNYPTYYPPAYTQPAVPYTAGGFANPYSPTAPGYGVTNPYSPIDPSLTNPYNPYNPYNPNSAYGAGSVLTGQADIMRAYGQSVNSLEQARITRELANQAKIDTRKKQFEYEMFVKANTPTYTQEQERIAKITLRRIQQNSTPGEVSSGKALNLLLEDLRKFPGKKIALEPLTLSEGALAHVNVTKNIYGMGLLRDGGKLTIPGAVQDRLTAKQRQDLEKQLQHLVKEANNDRVDANVLKDVRNEIDRMREELVKKVNDIPTTQYIDAKRFLQELFESTRAIETGEATTQAKFQRYLDEGKGGRSIQEIADYMVKEGLRFGPATADDEAAYRAIHAAMASYNIAMNTQLGTESKE